jgi:hypothetical protein
MNASPAAASSADRALRRLFLTLFLRGRTSRGLEKERVPKSVGSKLALSLLLYALVGLAALAFRQQPVFSLALYLHGMTLLFLGMSIAASAGEVLFNKEEADILLHRPVTPRALLWAKVSVLVQVSLWLAGAFNLAGFWLGVWAPGGGWAFPIVHAISTTLLALFCTGCVVLSYELCLRWFGRERLEGLMTTVQVLVAVALMLGGQLVPRMLARSGAKFSFNVESWWMTLLPPAWFAGFDDAFAGSGARESWILAAIGILAVAVVLWLAFGKLAHHYEEGMQMLGQSVAARPAREPGSRRWIEVLLQMPPLRWWLREPVTRASFLLTAGYLFRDRETKLRIYPGLAPMLVMPVIFLLQDRGAGGAAAGFGVAFSGGFIGLVALQSLNLLQYSQQWQAADVFRLAPIPGPAQICAGARCAVFCFLAVPSLAALGLFAWCMRGGSVHLPLLLPGIIALPVYALHAHLGGRAVPFSIPGEEAKSAGRGLQMIGVMMISMAISGLAIWAWSAGWFGWLLLGETLLAVALYATMRASLSSVRWSPME